MKKVQRFDRATVKARFDDNGFLVDRPVVARIGLQVYETPYGKRREFRPASEVFKADSLESFAGKPITIGHTMITPDNADKFVVGSCSGAGQADGIGVVVPVHIYSKRAIESAKKRDTAEISVGYTSMDVDRGGWGNNATGEYFFHEDTPDGWKADSADWVEFDAVQTEIKVNHVALVFKGRAGVAKLNLDSSQEFPYDTAGTNHSGDDFMTVKIKLDGEKEFDVPKEVADHISQITAKADTATTEKESLKAERDILKQKVDGIPAIVAEAEKKAKADAEIQAKLIATAKEAGIKCDGLSEKEIKIAYVKSVLNVDVAQKNDAYIDSAFDIAVNSDNMAEQRKQIKGDAGQEKVDSESDSAPNPNSRIQKLNK